MNTTETLEPTAKSRVLFRESPTAPAVPWVPESPIDDKLLADGNRAMGGPLRSTAGPFWPPPAWCACYFGEFEPEEDRKALCMLGAALVRRERLEWVKRLIDYMSEDGIAWAFTRRPFLALPSLDLLVADGDPVWEGVEHPDARGYIGRFNWADEAKQRVEFRLTLPAYLPRVARSLGLPLEVCELRVEDPIYKVSAFEFVDVRGGA